MHVTGARPIKTKPAMQLLEAHNVIPLHVVSHLLHSFREQHPLDARYVDIIAIGLAEEQRAVK